MNASKVRSTGLVAGLVATLLVAGVAVAAAYGGSARKVIHACVDDQTGAIWIADNNQGCGPDAHALNWNERGPRGEPGPQGPPAEALDLGLTVVTQSTGFNPADRTSVNGSSSFGVGVDCPGDSVATGGGGSVSRFLFTTGQADAVANGVANVGLVESYALAHNSTSHPAGNGETPTGWWAGAGTGGFQVTVADVAAQPSNALTVTVWAVCSGVGEIED